MGDVQMVYTCLIELFYIGLPVARRAGGRTVT